MKLETLKPTPGSKKESMRRGRGIGTGSGKTSGRGHKGQKSRSGGGVRPGFEGGQNPIFRRIPKRGFKNYTQVTYDVVNIEQLNKFDEGTTVTPPMMVEMGMLRSDYRFVKVLARGKLDKKLKVSANKFSKSAEEAIIKAGGSIEVM
jgi:large subunit ribosomal protein L15